MERESQTSSKHPKIRFSQLRDIGWTLRDPIGLLGVEDGRLDDENSLGFADEYDTYLVSAAGQLRRGTDPERVAEYFLNMGLGETDRALGARAVVAASLADATIWTE